MSYLQLSLLGEPLIKHGETPLTFSTRKAQALLVYLALEGGLHPRKSLSEAFWPDLDARHGRAALRATLLELRRLFERSHEASEASHLRIEHDLLGIEQESSLVLDVRLVEAAGQRIEHGIASLTAQARIALLAQLEEAARLVRGPFLAGFSLRDSQFFDDWFTQHREYWHRRASQVFEALCSLYEQGGDVERASESVTRWLRFDPLHEEAYRRLMRLRFSQGDRVGALRAFSRCRHVLAGELQVEPEPETVALARYIRHTAPPRPVQAPCSPQATAGQSPAHLLDDHFQGRSAEFGALIESYQRARTGQAHLILLAGEAGIGKTRLSAEFARWAKAQGADVLQGKALQTGRQLPYQPLIDVLRHQMEQEQSPQDHLSNIWLAELARLLPEVRERYPNLPAPATDETCGNNRLFEAVSRLIRTWATRRPLVLLLDDMQWADPATLDLLHYLARSLAEQPVPVLLLFNLSTGPGDCTEAQMSWLLALKRTRLPLTELRLAPFTQEETRQFVQELKWARQPIEMDCTDSSGASLLAEKVPEGQQALSSFSHWLFRHTSGQPLYLRETLNELMARDILFLALQESGAWGLVLRPERLVRVPEGELIPQALRELMRSRITQLSPSAWMLLATASALEAGLSFERLCQVAGLDELEGLDVLEELLRGGWLSEATVLAGASLFDNYAFPCQIIREVVYQEAGATRRRIVQRRLAALIRAGIAGEQEEEVRVPHASTTEEYARSEKSTDTGLPVMARTLSHRSAGQWKTRKEENDAIHTTHTTPRRLPGAKNSGWRAGYTVPGR